MKCARLFGKFVTYKLPREPDPSLLLVHSDAQVPFVPETPDNLVVPMDSNGVPISCRVSNPNSHVTLRSVSTGDEMSAFYDNKMGFFGMLPPGQYQCETVVNSQMFRSDIYMVEDDGKCGDGGGVIK